MIRPGETAPGFTALDEAGATVSLESLLDRVVVLHFFPLAWTGVCGGEIARLTALQPEFDAAGARLVGLSCDSRFSLAAWKQAMGYTIQLLSDFHPHGEIGKAYGAYDETLGFHRRATFVIDPGGIVRETFETPEIVQARDVERYLDAVRSLSSA